MSPIHDPDVHVRQTGANVDSAKAADGEVLRVWRAFGEPLEWSHDCGNIDISKWSKCHGMDMSMTL